MKKTMIAINVLGNTSQLGKLYRDQLLIYNDKDEAEWYFMNDRSDWSYMSEGFDTAENFLSFCHYCKLKVYTIESE